MKRIKNVPVLFLLLALTVPGCGGFDTSIRRGLTVSQGTYGGAMDSVAVALEADKERAEEDKIVTPEIAVSILTYETRHRLVHNMTITLTEEYVKLREAKVKGDQLATLQARILILAADLPMIVAELITFLMENGIYENQN